MSNPVLTEEQLKVKCAAWQDMLCPEWDVRMKVVRVAEIPNAGLGSCDINVNKKQALVKLLHPDDYYVMAWPFGPPEDVAFEQERVLVHELMHPRFATLDVLIGFGTVAEVNLEQALHGLDKLLLELVQSARQRAAEMSAQAAA